MKIGGGTQRATKTGESRDAPPELAPFVFLVLACHDPYAGSARFSLAELDVIRFGRDETRTSKRVDEGGARVLAVRVPDPLMSAVHAQVVRDGDGYAVEDLGSTNGTRIDGARVGKTRLVDGDVFQLGGTLLLFREMLAPPGSPAVLHKQEALAISTLVPSYETGLIAFARVAASSVPILLLGESGTGKEVLARAAHALSGRRGAFVPVNCGALPETLTESQLFGHVKGAFSGAVRDEPGFVRASDKGTLFLDEIGDMPKTSQAALLRVLQEREVTPVGSTTAVKVDLRIVAATHRRVDALQGATDSSDGFRADLYARLAGFTHALLPLRERKEDLGLLVKALLARIAPDRRLVIAPELGRAICAYDWPLNVRELEQCLSVAAVLATDGPMKLEHLPLPMRRAITETQTESHDRASTSPPSDDATKDKLTASLTAHRGNISEVAREMGKTRMQIHRWMKRWGIDPDAFRK